MLDNGIGLQRRLTHVFGDESATIGLDSMTFLQDAEILVDAADDTCNGGLTSTWRTVEHEVVGDLGGLQALCLALLLQFDEVGQRAHLFLHAVQSDELVEFLIGVALEGFVDDDGVFLFRLLRLCGLGLVVVLHFLVVDEDAHDDHQNDKADAEASAAFQ